MRRTQGFTLIELMVTLIVLAILVAWAIPSFNKLIEKRRLIGVAEAVYEQLVNARAEAVKRSRPIVVEFSADGTTSWAFGMTDDLTGCDPGPESEDPCTVDFNVETAEEELVVMRTGSGDAVTVAMKGPSVDAPKFFNAALGACDAMTLADTRTCFDPLTGLARRGSVVLETANYTMAVSLKVSGTVEICTTADDSARRVPGYPACGAGILE